MTLCSTYKSSVVSNTLLNWLHSFLAMVSILMARLLRIIPVLRTSMLNLMTVIRHLITNSSHHYPLPAVMGLSTREQDLPVSPHKNGITSPLQGTIHIFLYHLPMRTTTVCITMLCPETELDSLFFRVFALSHSFSHPPARIPIFFPSSPGVPLKI